MKRHGIPVVGSTALGGDMKQLLSRQNLGYPLYFEFQWEGKKRARLSAGCMYEIYDVPVPLLIHGSRPPSLSDRTPRTPPRRIVSPQHGGSIRRLQERSTDFRLPQYLCSCCLGSTACLPRLAPRGGGMLPSFGRSGRPRLNGRSSGRCRRDTSCLLYVHYTFSVTLVSIRATLNQATFHRGRHAAWLPAGAQHCRDHRL